MKVLHTFIHMSQCRICESLLSYKIWDIFGEIFFHFVNKNVFSPSHSVTLLRIAKGLLLLLPIVRKMGKRPMRSFLCKFFEGKSIYNNLEYISTSIEMFFFSLWRIIWKEILFWVSKSSYTLFQKSKKSFRFLVLFLVKILTFLVWKTLIRVKV